jgi:hypothetical protein
MDTRYFKATVVNNRLDGEWLPGRIGLLNTSIKYVDARKRLNEFRSSGQVPQDVVEALKGFDDTIERNTVLMFDSINESLATDPRYIAEDELVGSKFYSSAKGAYWSKFEYLNPKAELIRVAVRGHLTR